MPWKDLSLAYQSLKDAVIARPSGPAKTQGITSITLYPVLGFGIPAPLVGGHGTHFKGLIEKIMSVVLDFVYHFL